MAQPFKVGNALLEIRDSELYRQDFKTFEDYCRQRWKMSRFYAHRLIDASEVFNNLLPIGNVADQYECPYRGAVGKHICKYAPTHESQVRPLSKLEPEEQREAWKIATEKTANRSAGNFPESVLPSNN
jgi:hypothetical protein